VKLRQLDVWGPIREGVHIAQKVLLHTPGEKLMDAFIGLLAGMDGVVEINRRVRPVVQILLNQADTLARSVLPGFQALLASEHVGVNLGEI